MRKSAAPISRRLPRDYAAGAETRGEIVIVIAPPPDDAQPSAADIDALLRARARRAPR